MNTRIRMTAFLCVCMLSFSLTACDPKAKGTLVASVGSSGAGLQSSMDSLSSVTQSDLASSLASSTVKVASNTSKTASLTSSKASSTASTISRLTSIPADRGNIVNLGGKTVGLAYPWETPLTPNVSAETDAYLARIADVEKLYNCKIAHINVPIADYYDQMINNSLAGNPFGDLMTMKITSFIPSARAGIMADLTDTTAYKNTLGKNLSDTAANALKVNGKYYSMVPNPSPIRSMLVFNKKILKENNLLEPYAIVKEGKWTWDVFERYLCTATILNGDGSIHTRGLQATWGNLGTTMIASNMGDVVQMDANGKYQFVMDSPNALEALNKEREWLHYGYIPNTEKAGSWDTPYIEFEQSKAAFLLTGGEWALNRLNQAQPGNFGVVHFPKGPKATGYVSPMTNFDSMFISKYTKYDVNTLVSLYIDLLTDSPQNMLAKAQNKWKTYTSDSQSIEMLSEVYTKNMYRYIGYGAFALDWNNNKQIEMDPTFWQAFGKVQYTPADLVQARKDPMKTYLDNYYNK